jgi:TfoX/Sxy family transcriptional regulator of competence genes
MHSFSPSSLPGVVVRPMFGARCFLAPNGRMFAFVDDDRLFLRLTGPEYERLLAAGGEPFMLRPGVPFGRWASVPPDLDEATAMALAQAAYRAVMDEGARPRARRRRRRLQ